MTGLFLSVITAGGGFYIGRRTLNENRPSVNPTDTVGFEGRSAAELLEHANRYRTLQALFEAVGKEGNEWKALERKIKQHPDLTFRKMASHMTDYDSTGSSRPAQPLEQKPDRISTLPSPPEIADSLPEADLDQMLAESMPNSADSTRQMPLESEARIQNTSFEFESIHGAHVLYIGNTVNGKATGQGKGVFDSGSVYEGQWRDNMRHGDGRFEWKDGDVYEGKYKFGRRDGYGVYTFSNGERYDGEWKDDKRHGKGTYYGKNGKILAEGDWNEDRLQ